MAYRNASAASGHTISKHRITMAIVIVVMAVLFVLLSGKTLALRETAAVYRDRVAELERQIADEEERSEDLEEQSIYIQTLQYVEQVARERLGLVYPDEVVLVPED